MSEDWGLLILRLVIGGLMAGHGAQKLFGWFGGYGFAGTRGFIGGALRLRPAGLWTLLAGLSELGGGLLLAAGLLNPLGALAIIAAMLMAIFLAHWPNFWVTQNGIEYPLVLLTSAAALAIAGPGAYSLDALLGIALPAPASLVIGLGAVLIGFAVALASRAPVAAPTSEESSAPTSRAA